MTEPSDHDDRAAQLGLDIGDIDIVIMLNPPPSAKAFRQRLGRMGRTRSGVCVVFDDSASVSSRGTLHEYISRAPEPNWLYLDNPYLQYPNALCAAHELRVRKHAGGSIAHAFAGLPARFQEMLENELNPSQPLDDELLGLKQRVQALPHYDFPLRRAVEPSQPSFKVVGPFDKSLGELSYAQALREAYPGAVYYYMATPYRIRRWDFRRREIRVCNERHLTTNPLVQSKVFPRFSGLLQLRRNDEAFNAEVEVQVSERVIGFRENRGARAEQHPYDVSSNYQQQPITRFLKTTGVCWFFPNGAAQSDAVGRYILEAFCMMFAVQPRDVGIGSFYAGSSPLGSAECKGLCIFDAVYGSLRLTRQLAERFPDVVEQAHSLAAARGDAETAVALASLADAARALSYVSVTASVPGPDRVDDEQCVTVIDKGGIGMLTTSARTSEVTIKDHRYTPAGLMYELVPSQPSVRELVRVSDVQPIFGKSPMVRLNLNTWESQPVQS